MGTHSLREEIAKCIHKMHPEFYHNDQVADEILKLIEKRIDSILKSENFNNHNSTVYEDGFTDAVEKIKEMLK